MEEVEEKEQTKMKQENYIDKREREKKGEKEEEKRTKNPKTKTGR